ncbi:MAG TPA: hypothetical protein VM842_05315 [Nitrospira sp.]|nr:hypothetical protein [Nitrospira sp.]
MGRAAEDAHAPHGLAGAVVGDRLYFASGDIQSAGITGMRVVTDSHDIFEFNQR